jgi:RNA polymerase sigma-70 factor (ECF subfamily)
MPPVESAILSNLRTYVDFARHRLGDPHLAEDVVQESLLRAIRSRKQPAVGAEVVPWFYRILRRAIIDMYRRRGARERKLEQFRLSFPETPAPPDERMLCRCFRGLLPQLPESYRVALQKVDLEGGSAVDVAAQLGITANTLNVRLHRARKRLRSALEGVCRACSKHGCLDCTCHDPAAR